MKTLKLRGIILVLMILPSSSLFSQDKYEDVVYLKDSSIIRGMIIEQIPNVSIKIQTADRSVFFYKLEEIEKITKELKPSDIKQKTSKKQYPKKGITVQANLIYMFATAEVSYLIYPVGIGIGTGLNSLSDEGTGAYIPIYLNSKFFFINRRFSPYLGFDFGYYMSDDHDGMHINPNIGSKIMLTNHLALNFIVGIIWHRYDSYSSYPYSDYIEYESFPDFRLGISYRFGK